MAESGMFDQDCGQGPLESHAEPFESHANVMEHRCKTGACSPRDGERGVTQKGNIDA